MPTDEDLRRELEALDGKGYKAYKSIVGSWSFGDFELVVDHVQGDPYAHPSRLRARVPAAVAGFPEETRTSPHAGSDEGSDAGVAGGSGAGSGADSHAERTAESRAPYDAGSRARRIALRDYLARAFAAAARRVSSSRGTGKSGLIAIDEPGQQVLESTAVLLGGDPGGPEEDGSVEARFVVGLPARGRRILGRQAAEMLCDDVPRLVERTLRHSSLDAGRLLEHVETVEDAGWLRRRLPENGLVAFVADGASLPRRSGVDDRPLPADAGAVPFRSPDSLRVGFDLPNAGRVEGMGIPRGVTLIVGGGYHGKSTVLEALARGVYDHLPGDGRERVVTDPTAVKVRAEDGRRVCDVDISAFIADLPGGQDTRSFSTDNASGSTSQAANIVEALDAGARVLLVDEDTSATNFMIRDHRMQQLIAPEQEPITPFVDRVRQLHDELGVSTVLVMGGSGDYFDVADRVVAMEAFVPREVTAEAERIAADNPTGRQVEGRGELGTRRRRAPLPDSLDPSKGKRDVKLRTRETEEILFGREAVDLGGVEQLVHPSQLRAVAEAMVWAKRHAMDGERPLDEVLDRVLQALDEEGMDAFTPWRRGDLARFRRHELAAAVNRLRTLEVFSSDAPARSPDQPG